MAVEDDYLDHLRESEAVMEDDDENVLSQISTKRVLEEVQHLSPAYRTVFNLYVLEGLSHQEIADSLGISVGTSKSNLAESQNEPEKGI